MFLTHKTKMAIGHITLLIISIIIAMIDHFYVGKLHRASSAVENTILKLDYFCRFQLTLEQALMPANDYLIHGNPVEKANHANLIKQLDYLFRTSAKIGLTDEERALLKDAYTKFDDVKLLSEEIFALETPVGSKAGREIMEKMDALANVIQERLETINVTRYEDTMNAVNSVRSLYDLEHKVYWVSIGFLIIFASYVALSVHSTANEIERKAMESETGKREWEKMFDAISDFVTIHDKDYNLIRANKAVAERFNTNQQALVGKKCYELFHGALEPPVMCPHKKTMETWRPAFAEMDNPRLGGIFLTSTYPVMNEKGEPYAVVHIVKDVTEIRKADQIEMLSGKRRQ